MQVIYAGALRTAAASDLQDGGFRTYLDDPVHNWRLVLLGMLP